MGQHRAAETETTQGETRGRHALRAASGLDTPTVDAPRDDAGTGEVELVDRVRAGDDDALLALVQRHRGALERAGADVTVDSLSRAGRHVARWLRSAEPPVLPFRAALLAAHLRGEPPTLPLDEPVWRGYAALPATARVALWHREVEGDRPGRIATHLDVDADTLADLLASTYAALRRRIALDHPAAAGDASADCRRWAELFRFSPPARLSRDQAAGLAEHGAVCADCRPLTAALLALDHDLARTLARPVLGPLTDGYLAARPRHARGARIVRLHGAPPPGAVPSHRSARRPRSLRAPGSFSLVGAGSLALMLATPGAIHSTDPHAPVAPTPGAVVRQAGQAGEAGPANERSRAGAATRPAEARRADRDAAPTPATGGSSGATGPSAPGGSDQAGTGGDTGGAPAPGAEPTPPPPTDPTPPTGPTTPAPETGDSGLLDVDLDEDGASVTLDPQLPSGPIQIELPLPIDLSGLPDLPAVPHLPGAGDAGRLGAPVGGALQPGLY